jgi:hypothetical protein
MILHRAPSTLTRQTTLSAVHRGIAYEEHSMRLLQDGLSMSLRRVGGKADGGIDLQGWWWLPSNDSTVHRSTRGYRRFRVLAQCKAEAKKLSPKYIREMEGVLHRFNVDPSYAGLEPREGKESTLHPVVGMMISSTPFSRMAALHAHSSPLPFILLHVPEQDVVPEESEPTVPQTSSTPATFGSIVFNPALGGTSGILRGEVEARWEYASDTTTAGRLGLWWKGMRLQNWTPDITSDLQQSRDYILICVIYVMFLKTMSKAGQ